MWWLVTARDHATSRELVGHVASGRSRRGPHDDDHDDARIRIGFERNEIDDCIVVDRADSGLERPDAGPASTRAGPQRHGHSHHRDVAS